MARSDLGFVQPCIEPGSCNASGLLQDVVLFLHATLCRPQTQYLTASSRSVACFYALSGVTALTHLYKLWVETE